MFYSLSDMKKWKGKHGHMRDILCLSSYHVKWRQYVLRLFEAKGEESCGCKHLFIDSLGIDILLQGCWFFRSNMRKGNFWATFLTSLCYGFTFPVKLEYPDGENITSILQPVAKSHFMTLVLENLLVFIFTDSLTLKSAVVYSRT